MRRAHPFVYIAVWAAVTLLAVAGFAAFQIQERAMPEPSSAALGREVGAMAGLGFNAARGQVAVAVSESESSEDAPATTDELLTSSSRTEEEEPPPVDTVPTHGWLSEMQVRALVARYFKPEDVNRAIRVAWCQSRFNPTSSNPETGATGLFHHVPEFWTQRAEAAGFAGAAPTDPEANVAAAASAVYDEGGWAVFPCS